MKNFLSTSPHKSKESVIAFLLLCFASFIMQSAFAEELEVNLGEVKKLAPNDFDESDKETLRVELKLEDYEREIESCGVRFVSAKTNNDEILNPKWGVIGENELPLNNMTSGSFAKRSAVGLSFPLRKAKTVTFSGAYCVFLPDESGRQKLVFPNAFELANKPFSSSLFNEVGVSLGFFDEQGLIAVNEKSYEILNEKMEESSEMEAFVSEFGQETGEVLFKYFGGSYQGGTEGVINILGTGALHRILKIQLTAADGSELNRSQKGALTIRGEGGRVTAMAYHELFFDTPPKDAQLVMHFANDKNFMEIPFTVSFKMP